MTTSLSNRGWELGSNNVLKRGDIIRIDFDPQAGKEIAKRRPALVISPDLYNSKSHLILCCPITSTRRNGPWEVELPKELKTQGVILSNQVKSMDSKARRAEKVERVTVAVITEVLDKLGLLVKQ